MRKIKKSEIKFLGIIAILQILLIVNSIPAESFISSQTFSGTLSVNLNQKNNLADFLKGNLGILVGFLEIKQIGFVSAAEEVWCCELTTDDTPDYPGAICAEVSDESLCASSDDDRSYSKNPSLCSETSFCTAGTCVIDNGLDCNEGVIENICEADFNGDGDPDGEWHSENSDEIDACDNGACVFPDGAIFTTLAACKLEYLDRGLDTDEIDWKSELDETQTTILSLALSLRENKGACVSDGQCRIIKNEECPTEEDGANFFGGFLCTHPGLKDFGVTCYPTTTLSCWEDRELMNEIYFKDSCLNFANIYDADMVREPSDEIVIDGTYDGGVPTTEEYWSFIISKADSCGLDPESNLQTCGNCAKSLGSICSETTTGETPVSDGEFICKNLKCQYDLNLDGNTPEINAVADGDNDKDSDGMVDEVFGNGESWCVYTGGAIGNQTRDYKTLSSGEDTISADTPGSEHWKLSCINGEIIPEPPESEGRTKICVPDITNEELSVLNEDGEPTGDPITISFRSAHYEDNLAALCAIYNPLLDSEGNDKERSIGNCEENAHCYIKEIMIDKNRFGEGNGDDLKLKVCVPRYPLGTGDYCPMATLSCPTIYAKGGSSKKPCGILNPGACVQSILDAIANDWDQKGNENCEEATFAEKMNNLCVSVGDCGNYINYNGKGTNNIDIRKNPGDISGARNEEWPSETENGYQPEDYDEFSVKEDYLGQAAISAVSVETGEECADGDLSDCDVNLDEANWKVGGVSLNGDERRTESQIGLGAGTMILLGKIFSTTYAGSFYTDIEGPRELVTYGTTTSNLGHIAPFFGAVVGGIIGAEVGGWLAEQAGVSQNVANLYIAAGSVAGAGAGYSAVQSWIAGQWVGWGPLAVWGFWTLVVLYLLTTFADLGKTETRNIDFICNPWQAPAGGEDCEVCNANSLIPCTEYACKSLGAACEFVSEDTEKPFCVSQGTDDDTPPILTLGGYNDDIYDIDNPAENFTDDREIVIGEVTGKEEYQDITEDIKCIQENTEITFNLRTDELAQCKWSFNANELAETIGEDGEIIIGGDYVGNGNWKNEHVFTMTTQALGILDPLLETDQQNSAAFIRCKDYFDKANIIPGGLYQVKFCVESEPDLEPPLINKIEPVSESYTIFGETEQTIGIWLKEKGTCRYSNTPGTSYELMASNVVEEDAFECSSLSSPRTADGYLCSGMTLSGIVSGENKFYIRCSDEGTNLNEGGGEGEDSDFDDNGELPPNVNQQDTEYILQSTATQLSISSIFLTVHDGLGEREIGLTEEASKEIKVGGDDIFYDLKATTSGGAYSGNAICSYDFTGPNDFSADFFSDAGDTETTTHIQEGLRLATPDSSETMGDYTISISCSDSIGNEDAANGVGINLIVDKTPPTIVRFFKEGNNLVLLTNEEAECIYWNDNPVCSEDVDEGTSMTTGFLKEHYTKWNSGETYYIKCKDLYNNGNTGSCMRTIIPEFDVA